MGEQGLGQAQGPTPEARLRRLLPLLWLGRQLRLLELREVQLAGLALRSATGLPLGPSG